MISFWRKRTPEPLGMQGEKLAVKHLKRAGYQILAVNAKLGRYEIDIIGREGDTIAFIEVKTRRTNTFAEPEANVNYPKQQRIRKAAATYIYRNPEPNTYYRYDIVSIVLPEVGKPVVKIFRDAFQDK